MSVSFSFSDRGSSRTCRGQDYVASAPT
jgi:hypothetical protein